MDRDTDAARAAPPPTADPRKPWADPILVKLEAGDAETGPLYSPDNTFGS